MEAIARPAATATAEPLLDRPVEALRFHGFRAGLTKSSSDVASLKANSFRVAVPSVTAPLSRMRVTTYASLSGIQFSYTRDAATVRMPAVAMRSL
jgi:hypothetical protein